MSVDVLAKTLEALHLRGTVYFKADFLAPWGMAMPSGDVASFHVVAAGRCWLRTRGGATLLKQGDIVLLPHGLAHELAHQEDAEARPAEEVFSEPKTVASRSSDGEGSSDGGGPSFGGEGEATTLVCGHFEYDRRALHPFFRTLPELVHVSAGQEEQAAWLATAARLAAAESVSRQSGASAVVDRLAEALLMQTLRLFLDCTPEPRGFLAAVRDPSVGRALSSLHRDPARDWSVPELAAVAALSRSAFSDRFRELVGESPMRYLSNWRMLMARELLRDRSVSVAEVAGQVGYRSEFSFSKAFKRHYGQGPSAARRAV